LGLAKYRELITHLLSRQYIVNTVDDSIINVCHKETPTIRDLYRELSTAEYYIGTDTG